MADKTLEHLMREFTFEDGDLEEQLDEIIDRVNSLGQILAKGDPDSVTLVNTSGAAIQRGSFVGFSSDGSLALADASDPIVKAIFVCPVDVSDGDSFSPVFNGVTDVRVATTVTLQRYGFLSTTAGEAQPSTPVKPDHSQVLGIWIVARDTSTGLAKMALMIDSASTRRT